MEILSTFILPKINSVIITDAIDYAVKVHSSELEDLNTASLDEGTDTEGKSLGRYKSISYKGRLRPVDLNKTGAFRKGIKAKSVRGVIEMDSKDGDDIVGIPRKSIESGEVGDILLESIISKVRQQINNA